MGRINDWLLIMESLAEETLEKDFSEEDAVQYMLDNLESSYPALDGTLRDVYRATKLRHLRDALQESLVYLDSEEDKLDKL
jgi:pheromone shutdown protein TraB|tara:strand:- start:1902 stop:2144 length:243 start_codon:yes stop_codon:yes gene_type:complete